jgi:hypothetical protein
MRRLRNVILIGMLGLAAVPAAEAKTLRFGGYTWLVKTGESVGPGPNRWREANAWVDRTGALHLKLSRQGARWYAAEVSTLEALPFGRYEVQIAGAIDRLDRNVVLGFFNYPADWTLDGTNEIDIELARWGEARFPNLNFTAWPAESGLEPQGKSFEVSLRGGTQSFHRFDWTSRRIRFESFRGTRADNRNRMAAWTFQPADPTATVPQSPLPFHVNLWLFEGRPPANGREVEVVLRGFKVTPLD